jgi:glycerol-3-phosphate acyltransferase PlsY
MVTNVLYIVGAYLLGAVPFGLIFSRVLGSVDVRTVGSGNIGATNVLRAAGKGAALLTLLADALKGFLPAFGAQHFFPDGPSLAAGAGIASIIGHNFPIYLSFKGGKGVATSFGVVLAVAPWIGLASLLAWMAAALIWRFSSLAAMIAFALYPLLVFSLGSGDRQQGMLSLFIFGMIYFRHRENIRRLLAGTEPKIGQKK